VRQINYAEDDDIDDDVNHRREKIAQDMWDSYQRVLEDRAAGEGDESGDDDDDDDDDGGNFTEVTFNEDNNFLTV
jgi:hypothetical protein